MYTITDICNLRKKMTSNDSVLNNDILILHILSLLYKPRNAPSLEVDPADEYGLLDAAHNVMIVKPCCQERSFVVRTECFQ